MQGLAWVGRRYHDQLHNQALVLHFLVYIAEYRVGFAFVLPNLVVFILTVIPV